MSIPKFYSKYRGGTYMLNILQETTKLVDVGVVDSENYNFHLEGYEFVLQQAKDMNKCLEQFYSSINSRSNILTESVLLTESFDTFTGKIREIVSKFLKFIKRIFDKFIAQMSALFRSEKYIEKNKNELHKFTSDMDFKIQGYKFTKLMDDIPLSNAYNSFFDDKSLKLKDFISNTKDIKKITSSYDSFMDGLEENYEAFRAEVLNMKGEYLTASQFDDELFTIFRDDNKTTSEIEITETEVSESLTQFIGYKNHLKAIEKTRDEIIRDYTRLEKDLNRLISIKDGKLSYNRAEDISDYSRGQLASFEGDQDYSDTALSTYNIDTGNDDTAKAASAKTRKMINDKLSQFIKAKATQVNKYSSIHSLAFTAKIQAVKDNFIQNKIILTKALVRIKGRKDK